jgi:hypothetical protein
MRTVYHDNDMRTIYNIYSDIDDSAEMSIVDDKLTQLNDINNKLDIINNKLNDIQRSINDLSF